MLLADVLPAFPGDDIAVQVTVIHSDGCFPWRDAEVPAKLGSYLLLGKKKGGQEKQIKLKDIFS